MSTPRKSKSSSQANPGPKPAKPKPTKEEMLARFKGRTRKGRPNRISHEVKDALLKAAAKVGSDGKGKDGLIGYWERIARDNPTLTAKILAKIMPIDMRREELYVDQQLRNKELNQQMQPSALLGAMALQQLTSEQLRIIRDSLLAYVQEERELAGLNRPSLKRLDKPNSNRIIEAEFENFDDTNLN